MPAKNRGSRYADRAALQSLGLFTDTSLLRNVAKRANNGFNCDHCEARIISDLLPHQHDFVTDFDHRMVALCGGFGSGKSWAAVAKTVLLCFRSQGFTHLFLEPTIPNLRDIAIPAWEALLEKYSIPYEFKSSPLPVYKLKLPKGDTPILLRSFENYQRLIGVNAASMMVDEIDTASTHIAEAAIIKLQGRVRVGNCPQLGFASTPEGHKSLYNLFVREASDEKALYKARTEDNPFLDPGFIQNLRNSYPPNLIEAYLNGEFVSLNTSLVFYEFDRAKHGTTIFSPLADERIIFGADFNIGRSQSCYGVMRSGPLGQMLHVFDEHTCGTTFDLVEHLKRRFPSHLARGLIVCHPDASGSHSSTSSTQTDHDILRSAGVRVIAENRNPPVAETLAHANMHIAGGSVLVNLTNCVETVDSLEQWAYDDNYKPAKGGKNDRSHAGDSFRYLIWHTMPRSSMASGRGPRWR